MPDCTAPPPVGSSARSIIVASRAVGSRRLPGAGSGDCPLPSCALLAVAASESSHTGPGSGAVEALGLEQFRIYYIHCYLNTHRKLLSSPRPLQSISRAHIIVRPLFSSLQPMFRAYRAYHVYYITIRHKPKQLAAGLLNIATAEIFSGLEEEPLQMSTNFSNFLVYGTKSLKLTEALCSTIGLRDARGRVGKKVACSLVVGIHKLPLKGVLPGWRMLLEEKRERHETGTLQSCHHGNVTQWHRAFSSLLFSFFFGKKVLVQTSSTFLCPPRLGQSPPMCFADALRKSCLFYAVLLGSWGAGMGTSARR
ncbi:LOW QUALITY PROTEIN: uncharacterized protein LOC134759982 [Pongo abelii]|uniref:LOW QUALITY PROTEIN: uncharacterized protein LOC134759982 n=1 Tax=Pongo abelii TaxID=9601 RepID=UPI003007C96B